MGTTLQPSLALLGRVLVSVIFLLSGVMKIMDWSGTLDHMATQGMPASSFLLALATLAEIVGGLALLLGWLTRPAAFLLFLYLIPTTLIFHNFWAVEVAREQQNQMFHFLKNVAIMGGLLELSAFGAGAWSLDSALAGLNRPVLAWRTGRRPV